MNQRILRENITTIDLGSALSAYAKTCAKKKPQDKENHAMDSIRYAVYSRFGRRENFFVI